MNVTFNDLLAQTTTKLDGWAQAFFAMLPNLALAAIMIGLAWLVAIGTSRLTVRAMERLTPNRQLSDLSGRLMRLLTVGLGLFFALGILELEKTVTSLVAGLGVVGIALGFAFQDVASNFMSGLLMAIRRPFEIGDFIETAGHTGTVQAIDLRSTLLLRVDGVHVTIPNSEVYGNAIVNYTKVNPRRVDLDVGVGYGSDLDEVQNVVCGAIAGLDNLLEDRGVDVFFTGFGGSSIDISVRFWTDNSRQGGWLKSRSDAIMRITAAFRTQGIEIPYPIRTLDLPQAHIQDFVEAFPTMASDRRSRQGSDANAA